MARPKKDYRIKLQGHRAGRPFFDLLVDGKKHRLAAIDQDAALIEGAARYQQVVVARYAARAAQVAPGPHQPPVQPQRGSLREAVAAYTKSGTYKLYKPLTDKQRRNHFKHILMTPATNGRHVLGESAIIDWLHGADAPDAVVRIMGLCGTKVAQAHRRLVALNEFFKWLLDQNEPEAAAARTAFCINPKAARNPCAGLRPPERKRDANGSYRSGHQYLTNDQVEDWKDACKDDLEQHRAVRFLQICGPRISDLHRLNRGMLKMTPAGLVLRYRPTKGDGSAFRDGPNPDAIVPVVPDLQALINEVPADRFTFIHSDFDRPYQSAASFGNRVRKWRREAGLPEGLSAHGMRKAATHWWLRNHRDLIPNNFALKTIFGWVTDKELNRYTRDFDREAEADGMLIKLNERRKAS